jgi:hypothetical protein
MFLSCAAEASLDVEVSVLEDSKSSGIETLREVSSLSGAEVRCDGDCLVTAASALLPAVVSSLCKIVGM